ncbi:hypothetical protein HPB52_004382 [Rhipicephalus sanguineus]|uniref:Uncharacterized protein n=1 Tax=Rhipicephalus sanguineus TaxID=34632 RepID=A0A9D4Q9K7_RHISA|nr:hypothetical protein HPB52_004382 [Rhipicephalus sanguineus]
MCVVRGRTTSLGVWPIGGLAWASQAYCSCSRAQLPAAGTRVSSAPVRRRTTGIRRGDPASSDFVTAGDGAATTSSSSLKGADGEATTAQAATPYDLNCVRGPYDPNSDWMQAARTQVDELPAQAHSTKKTTAAREARPRGGVTRGFDSARGASFEAGLPRWASGPYVRPRPRVLFVLKGTTPCRRNPTTGIRRGDPASSDFVTAGDGAATTSSSSLKGADGEATTAQATTPTT